MDRVGFEPTTSTIICIPFILQFLFPQALSRLLLSLARRTGGMIVNIKQSPVVVVAIIAAALVFTSSLTTAHVADTTTSDTTATTSASSVLELSAQPVWV